MTIIQLNKFLKKYKLSIHHAARLLGYFPSVLHRIVHGERKVSRYLAREIFFFERMPEETQQEEIERNRKKSKII